MFGRLLLMIPVCLAATARAAPQGSVFVHVQDGPNPLMAAAAMDGVATALGRRNLLVSTLDDVLRKPAQTTPLERPRNA